MKLLYLMFSAALCLSVGAAVAQSKNDVFRIGVLGDHTGPYADFSGPGAVVAARLAVEDFGATVLGRKIEILSADHQNKADIASNTARQWIDVDGVHALADLTNSAVAIAVQSLARDRGKIALFSGPATTRLTNEDCSPTGFHWVMDTYSQSIGSARAVIQEGGKNWFLLVADYAFGHQMAADLRLEITANGGKIVGEVRHPTNTADFSSFLLQAQASGASIIGLANGGNDTINSVKQAAEFAITDNGQKLVGLVLMISDVHAMGLSSAKGLVATTAYYWDRDEGSRAFARRYEQHMKRKPTQVHAGVYSSVLHYLRAVQAAGTDDGKVVAETMREMPVNDIFVTHAKIRTDGRLVHDMYLVGVKRPEELKGPWDYYNVIRTIPAEQTVTPLADSKCYLVTKN